MEKFLNMLPILYIYWACGLIVWSSIACTMQAMVISHNRKRYKHCRRFDLMMFMVVGICGTFLGISVFVIPQVTTLFVEIALMLVLWYTVFLVAINHINILCFMARK